MDLRRRLLLRGRVVEARATVVPPRPPWSLRDEGAFTARCTRCGDCVRACPHTLLRAGDGGFPEIDLRAHGCDFCGACARACPSGAIGPVPVHPDEAAATAFVQRARVSERCLTRRGIECRLCAEHCAPAALRFQPAHGSVWRLTIDTAACTGCGECLAPCPVQALSVAVPEADPPSPAGAPGSATLG